jgi:hypothetical protein
MPPAFADPVELEFSERRQHVSHQPTGRRRSVHAEVDGDECAASGLEPLERSGGTGDGARETVKLGDDDPVCLAALNGRKRLLKGRAVVAASGLVEV